MNSHNFTVQHWLNAVAVWDYSTVWMTTYWTHIDGIGWCNLTSGPVVLITLDDGAVSLPCHPAMPLGCHGGSPDVSPTLALALTVVLGSTATCCQCGLSMFGASTLFWEMGVGNWTAVVTTGEYCTKWQSYDDNRLSHDDENMNWAMRTICGTVQCHQRDE